MKEEIELELVKVDEAGYHLLVPCELSDKLKCFLILDTGASNTVMDRVSLKNYITPTRTGDYYIEEFYNKSMDSSRGISNHELHFSFGKLESLKIGTNRLNQMLFPLLDLTHISEIYSDLGFNTIIGVLGCDFMVKTNAVIDFKNKKLSIELEAENFRLV